MSKQGTYDQVATGWKIIKGRYHLTIRYQNSDTGEHANEISTASYQSEQQAEKAAVMLAKQLQTKLKEAL
jgi:hypothetical protein